jgi:hypothetical protein
MPRFKRSFRSVALAVLCIGYALSHPLVAFGDGPPFPGDLNAAVVVLPPSPADGPTAAASFPTRADLYLTYVACRQEDRFLHDLQVAQSTTKDNKPLKNGADNTDHVLLAALAKLKWLKANPSAPECIGDLPALHADEASLDNYIWGMAFAIPYLAGPCAAVTGVRFSIGPDGPEIHVSRACLTAEVNLAFRAIQRGYALPGSSGLPCNLFEAGTVTGDWDMRMKVLIRAILLDQQTQSPEGPILAVVVPVDNNLIFAPVSPLNSVEAPAALTTHDYILQQLITVDGDVGNDSYSWTGCGDNEYATGSPQDREDSHEGADNYWNSIEDALDCSFDGSFRFWRSWESPGCFWHWASTRSWSLP